MKNLKNYTLLVAFLLTGVLTGYAQFNRDLQNYRYPDQRGVNVFESPKTDTEFDGVNVRVGGAFALQFQGLDHSNSAVAGEDNELIELAKNFNLATANLDLDVGLYDGVRLHMRTYLSSRHHAEAWVKGGYLQVDKLDFISEGFLEEVMDMVTVKVGHMEINYGDAHFRRSDNGTAIYNPFVGNYILDAFNTEVGGEVYLRKNGFLGMVGLTNGKLNQSPTNPGSTGAVFLGKLGYDDQLSDDLRLRLTGSVYTIGKASSIYLYSGDRAGSRYYNVMQLASASRDNFRSGRWNPGFADKITSFMVNPFLKYRGLEVFGVIETTTGGDTGGSTETRTWNQLGGEVIYRFGGNENVYLGGRYNTASGKLAAADANEVTIDRLQLGGGWFLTRNILTKVEYVQQNYKDFPAASEYNAGEFNGIMLEAVIGF